MYSSELESDKDELEWCELEDVSELEFELIIEQIISDFEQ